jgi:hypothetical protein
MWNLIHIVEQMGDRLIEIVDYCKNLTNRFNVSIDLFDSLGQQHLVIINFDDTNYHLNTATQLKPLMLSGNQFILRQCVLIFDKCQIHRIPDGFDGFTKREYNYLNKEIIFKSEHLGTITFLELFDQSFVNNRISCTVRPISRVEPLIDIIKPYVKPYVLNITNDCVHFLCDRRIDVKRKRQIILKI